MSTIEELIRTKNIDTIFVDIDDTLYDYEHANSKSLNLCYKDFLSFNKNISLKKFKKDYRACRNIIRTRFKNNGTARSRILAFQLLLENYSFDNAYIHALDFEKKYWKYLINNMRANKTLINTLKSLKNDIKICAVTDMQMRYQVKKIKKLGLHNTINFMVTSEECGVEKPNKIIFEYALKKTSSLPSQTLMIGDNFQKDISGASSMNIHTVHEKYISKDDI